MSDNHDSKHRGTTGGALDIKPEHVTRANLTDGELHGKTDAADMDPDALGRLDATSEAIRQKSDTIVLKSDLEDKDIRDSAPGTQEQD